MPAFTKKPKTTVASFWGESYYCLDAFRRNVTNKQGTVLRNPQVYLCTSRCNTHARMPLPMNHGGISLWREGNEYFPGAAVQEFSYCPTRPTEIPSFITIDWVFCVSRLLFYSRMCANCFRSNQRNTSPFFHILTGRMFTCSFVVDVTCTPLCCLLPYWPSIAPCWEVSYLILVTFSVTSFRLLSWQELFNKNHIHWSYDFYPFCDKKFPASFGSHLVRTYCMVAVFG